MTSLSEVFRIGLGPSSSHTMAPEKAASYMLRSYPEADSFRVTLFGSLCKTGRGHRTDYAILQAFGDISCEILWNETETELPHPNTMEFTALRQGEEIGRRTILSIGGGAIEIPGEPSEKPREVYKETSFDEIAALCKSQGWSLSDYVYANEPEIRGHLAAVWEQMQKTIEAGIRTEGELPGGLHVKRRAPSLYRLGQRERDVMKKEHFLISAYAYASSEENAAGGRMVTAPTCGACGVLPAVLYYEKGFFGHTDQEMLDALATAGIIGQLLKTNASVSGAEAGCQAEVGSACSMAAAALCTLQKMSLEQTETAAEIAMEHCLGLTCDPVGGLVQIPCIERNAVGALRSYDAATLAEAVYDNRRVSFDTVVKTMLQTGKDLAMGYRETSEGGLARCYVNKP